MTLATLLARSVPTPSGCLLFGNPQAKNRYSMVRHQGKPTNAHRVAYLLARGEITNGLEVCHSCDNTRCINPAHLFLGTHKQNMVDMSAKGRQKNQHQQAA